MNEEPTKDLATRAFQKRVLDEFAGMRAEISAMRTEQSAMRSDITEMRSDIVEIRTQQAAMAKNIGALDQRLTSLEERVDARLKETRPIWEAVQEQIQRVVESSTLCFWIFMSFAANSRFTGGASPNSNVACFHNLIPTSRRT
jgi:chromosome segregation ATPase